MSDDLTPAEQARAARWRVGKSYCIHVYCGDRPVATFLDPGDALDAVIARNAYRDPPETVESLRAELRQNRDEFAALCAHRDSVAAERAQARADVAYWREKLAAAECVIRDHITAQDAMRAERDEANETVKSLQADCEELAVWLGFERAETARLRATHTQAEAAWARCKPGAPDTIDRCGCAP